MKIIYAMSSKLPNKAKKPLRIFLNEVRRHRLTAFITFSLVIAIVAVSVSLWTYSEFGTAELDLSRPSYQEAREQAQREAKKQKSKENTKKTFDSQGVIDTKTIDEFKKLYKEELKKIDGDFFGNRAISDETLNITDEKIEGAE